MRSHIEQVMTERDDWRNLARSLAYWLERHVDPPNGSAGCPETCDARRALARYRQEEARRGSV